MEEHILILTFRTIDAKASKHSASWRTCHKAKLKRNVSGWKSALRLNCGIVSVVLLINLAMLIVTELHFSTEGEHRVLYEGSCETTERLSVLSHIVINALSTFLLGASNYTMQVLAAPTRKEVEYAHRREKVLDIGIHSPQNFVRTSKAKGLLWVLILLSSIPLHLM